MSGITVEVEKLSKQYQLSHSSQNLPYLTLRDEIMSLPKNLLHWMKGNAPFSSSEIFWALKDVSFQIPAGEVVGIIGRNGSGKSTLLKILSRITPPSEGKATIRGRIGSLLEVGSGFHPELTGRENIFLNGAILGMAREEIKRKFDEIVAFSECEQFLDTPVKRYSSGMYTRLAFAVAAHLETEILLVDEVLAVGDVNFQKKCLGKMKTISQSGRTVLFVSHSMNAVEQMCTTVLTLENGRQKYFGKDVRAAIKDYMFRSDEVCSSEWVNKSGKNYQNPWFMPLRFFICDEGGDPLQMPASNKHPMWLQIEGEVRELDASTIIGYAIYTEDGNLVYWSYHTDQAEDQWPELTKGITVLRAKIPARFLNEGTYKVEIMGGHYMRPWFIQPGVNAPSIYLTIQGGLSDSAYWMFKRSGIMAPVLPWIAVRQR